MAQVRITERGDVGLTIETHERDTVAEICRGLPQVSSMYM
jgi:hypothetical protein